jgi:hypothetical protein
MDYDTESRDLGNHQIREHGPRLKSIVSASYKTDRPAF